MSRHITLQALCVCVCAPVFVCVPCWGLQAPRQVSISPIITSQSPLLPWLPPSRVSQYRACEGAMITPKLVGLLAGWSVVYTSQNISTLFLHPSIHRIRFYSSSSLNPPLTIHLLFLASLTLFTYTPFFTLDPRPNPFLFVQLRSSIPRLLFLCLCASRSISLHFISASHLVFPGRPGFSGRKR